MAVLTSNKVSIEIKTLDPEVQLPSYAYEGDAGCDLCSREDLSIQPQDRAIVGTGIAVAIPDGYAGFVQPRSGLAAKSGITIVNAPGLIDSHYRGEIKVVLLNTDRVKAFDIKKGDRIAQLVIQRVEQAIFTKVNDLPETHRGEGGFGSSGTR